VADRSLGHAQRAEAEGRKLFLERDILKWRRRTSGGSSRAGNYYDNTMMQTLWATLQQELVHDRRFRAHEEARTAAFE